MSSAARVVALAEGAISERLLTAVAGATPGSQGANAFGQRVTVEPGTDAAALVARAGQVAEGGERVAVVAHASDLAAARREIGRLARRRLGVVVHAVPGAGDPGGSDAGLAPALSLGDLPCGMLVAAGPGEALDLTLVARRAAEDSGCPCIVVHDWAGEAGGLLPLQAGVCAAFLGGPKPERAPAGEGGRALAERLPFALGSALRELEGLVGRRLDVFERSPSADAALALVGMGAVGRRLVEGVARLREAGHDVVALRLVAWRPLAAPRLVKALCRAHSVAVVEGLARPVAAPPLVSALKAAFADALTWAPGFPGIGRIPRVESGLVAPGDEPSDGELDALVANILAGERGARTFTLEGGSLVPHDPE